MGHRLINLATAGLTIALTSACGTGAPPSASITTAPSSTLAANVDAPAKQGSFITPQMQNAVGALGEQGRSAFADVWGALSMDPTNNQVVLYATDVARAEAMIKAARHAHPNTAGVPVVIVKCSYTSYAEHQAVARVAAAAAKDGPQPYIVHASPSLDGSGVRAYVPRAALQSPALTQQLSAAAAPVRVTLLPEPASPVGP